MKCVCLTTDLYEELVTCHGSASLPPSLPPSLFPSLPPSLTLPVVSCFPASPHRLDSQSTEGHSHKHISHLPLPPPPPAGWQETSVCLRSSERQREQTANLRCSDTACVSVYVWMCVCVSASVFPQASTVCVCLQWCVVKEESAEESQLLCVTARET